MEHNGDFEDVDAFSHPGWPFLQMIENFSVFVLPLISIRVLVDFTGHCWTCSPFGLLVDKLSVSSCVALLPECTGNVALNAS